MFGIGNDKIKVSELEQPYYNTLRYRDEEHNWRTGVKLNAGKYIYIMDGEEVIMALLNTDTTNDAYIIASSPRLLEGKTYQVYEAGEPISDEEGMIGSRYYNKCSCPTERRLIDTFEATLNTEYKKKY